MNFGASIPAASWHTVIALEENSILLEMKDGPFHFETAKDFAPWASEEGSKGDRS